jgi:hypothetical protein
MMIAGVVALLCICATLLHAYQVSAFRREPTTDKCARLPEKVEKFIKYFATEVRGFEYCGFRKIARGDINSDGIEDLIVLFSVEGACNDDKSTPPGDCGNHLETYLKAFLGKELKEVPLLRVGSRGERFVTGISVKNGVIEAETLTYGEDDPMCCPSIKGKTTFVHTNDVLTEKRP